MIIEGNKIRCPKCETIKHISSFYHSSYNSTGYSQYCKDCSKKRVTLWAKNNKEKKRLAFNEWKKKNPDKIKKYHSEWYKNNKDKSHLSVRKWRENYPERAKRISRESRLKRLTIPRNRLSKVYSNAIYRHIKNQKGGRHWGDVVGYSLDDLQKHLEKQFKEGMTWENYGEWQIDHIIPISAFNFEKSEDDDFKTCWSLKNLQPLWFRENRSKSNRLSKHFQPKLIFT